MKKYVEKIDRWKTAKALTYLGNFLKNHQRSVNDNDVFKPVTDLLENCDWGKKIRCLGCDPDEKNDLGLSFNLVMENSPDKWESEFGGCAAN